MMGLAHQLFFKLVMNSWMVRTRTSIASKLVTHKLVIHCFKIGYPHLGIKYQDISAKYWCIGTCRYNICNQNIDDQCGSMRSVDRVSHGKCHHFPYCEIVFIGQICMKGFEEKLDNDGTRTSIIFEISDEFLDGEDSHINCFKIGYPHSGIKYRDISMKYWCIGLCRYDIYNRNIGSQRGSRLKMPPFWGSRESNP